MSSLSNNHVTQVRMKQIHDSSTDDIFVTTHDAVPKLNELQVKINEIIRLYGYWPPKTYYHSRHGTGNHVVLFPACCIYYWLSVITSR
ncbi:hypothetical protein [uncultured Paraglaciecola sp.]|uniref:hypothetical protein n=1 Tax=uncultured Paraglaciecola sp. TaxID=1765024 RepID=UPI0026313312|nr:hypothetical protein [uncultured Paraglaciecola sp.]